MLLWFGTYSAAFVIFIDRCSDLVTLIIIRFYFYCLCVRSDEDKAGAVPTFEKPCKSKVYVS